jgi:predicted esterase
MTKKKILCLHGGGMTGDSMSKVFGSIASRLEDTFEFVYPNGSENVYLSKNFNVDGQFRLGKVLDFEKDDFVANGHLWVGDFSAMDISLEKSTRAIQQIWDDSFVGIIGFSQGAFLASLMIQDLEPQPQFTVFLGGMLSDEIGEKHVADSKKGLVKVDALKRFKAITGNCIHCHGISEAGWAFFTDIPRLETFTHSGGHQVPAFETDTIDFQVHDPESAQKILDWINSQ